MRISTLAVASCLLVAGCHAASAPPAPERPVSLSFRPTHDGQQAWLATPFAVEITSERDARILEMADATYIGEINVGGGKLKPANASLIAAEWGATHFRISTSQGGRVDVILWRVDKDRWSHLPQELQPSGPNAASALTAL